MSFLARFLPKLLNPARSITQTLVPQNAFHSLTQGATNGATSAGGLFQMTVRNVIRVHFPRPSERKRIKRHGFWKRMSTGDGQRILLRRILKGRHVLAH